MMKRIAVYDTDNAHSVPYMWVTSGPGYNVAKIKERAPKAEFGHVIAQRGMFSYSGLTKDQVLRLRKDYSIYAIETGRICVAALNSKNIDYVAEAIARQFEKADLAQMRRTRQGLGAVVIDLIGV